MSTTGAIPLDAAAVGHAGSSPVPTRANYILALLYGAYVLNFVDRQLLTLLMQDIKEELHLADWQLGLASGTSFALDATAPH